MSDSTPVAPGEGRGSLVDHKALRLGLLRGMSRYLTRSVAGPEAKRCRTHGHGHPGAAAQGARVHQALHRFTREDELLDRAREQVLAAVDAVGGGQGGTRRGLAPDPDDAWETALAVDAVAWLARTAPDVLGDEVERCLAAVTELAAGGLVPALEAADDVPGRLLTAVGLAQAGRLLERADWCDLARAAGDAALDGLSPEGLLLVDGDVGRLASRRQGLAPALWLALQQTLGAGPERDPRVVAALDGLCALRDGLGRKPLALDAEAGARGAPYEVASHPFDAFGLHTAAVAWPDHPAAAAWRVEAGRSMEEWIAHVHAMDGGIESHHGKGAAPAGCRLAWTAAGAWVARIAGDVGLHAAVRPPRDLVLPVAGLAHLEGARWTAVLRGRAAAGHAGRAGGSVVSLVVRPEPRVAQGVERVPPGTDADEGQFTWRARGALLGMGRGEVFASHLDRATALEHSGDAVVFTGGLADAAGRRLDGAVTTRRYAGSAEGLSLHDELRWTPPTGSGRGRLEYRLHRAWGDVELSSEGGDCERKGDRVVLRPTGGPLRLTVHGRWGLGPAT